jgi:DNA-binding NarL/FixJ family response regulator
MINGIEDSVTAKRTLALGAFGYVVKPVDLVYLAQAVELALMTNRVRPA